MPEELSEEALGWEPRGSTALGHVQEGLPGTGLWSCHEVMSGFHELSLVDYSLLPCSLSGPGEWGEVGWDFRSFSFFPATVTEPGLDHDLSEVLCGLQRIPGFLVWLCYEQFTFGLRIGLCPSLGFSVLICKMGG